MIKITFPDGSVREYEQGVTGLQIAGKHIAGFGTQRVGLRRKR